MYSVQLAIVAGSSTATLIVATEDDSANEADGTVTATVQPDPDELGNQGANYQPAANAEPSITVRDNDDPTVIISTLNIPDPSAVPGTPATRY